MDDLKAIESLDVRIESLEDGVTALEGKIDELLKMAREAKEFMDRNPAVKLQRAMQRAKRG